MRNLIAIGAVVVAAAIGFVLGSRRGPAVATATEALQADTSWSCMAPSGKSFKVGRKLDRPGLRVRVRGDATSAPVNRDQFLTTFQSVQWMLFIRIAEDSSTPIGGRDMSVHAMPARAVSSFISGMKCDRLAEAVAAPDVDLLLVGKDDGYETTITVDGEQQKSTGKWER